MYLIKKNMKKLFAILSFVAISGTVLAQSATPAADNQKKGEFKFEKEIHDFGSISEGENSAQERSPCQKVARWSETRVAAQG